MELSENTSQRLKSVSIFIFIGFKTIMASMLVLFVYQDCTKNECTLTDNLTSLTTLNQAALAFNFITLLSFIYLFGVELYRENYMIKYLDIRHNLPDDNLVTEIIQYPEIGDKLHLLNRHYYKCAICIIIINGINVALSTAVLTEYYGGINTIIGLCTNTLLIGDKLQYCIMISKQSLQFACSAYMKEPAIFNTIDILYKRTPETATFNICIDNPMINVS